jgi:putative ABC transport system permease protein
MSSESRLVVVSEDVVRRYWPDEEPIGKKLKFGPPDSDDPWREVIGVVGDTKYRGLPRNPTPDPDIYLPLSERSDSFVLTVRTPGDPGTLAQPLRAELKKFDSSIVSWNVASMRERVGDQLSTSRFAGSLMGLFAAVALLLALVGTYSVMSYLVSQRTQEIGIRMALGARPSQIFRSVVGQGFLMGAVGVGVGVAAALVLARFVASLLFGVSASNPVVIGSVALLMLAASLLACYLPARRATRVDPMVALRYE